MGQQHHEHICMSFVRRFALPFVALQGIPAVVVRCCALRCDEVR